jgi:hypothetical protein
MENRTPISKETRTEERRDASVRSGPDRSPTPEEEREADQLPPLDEDVRTAEEEALERGANVKGEGRV